MYGVVYIPSFFLQAQLRMRLELRKQPVVLLESAGKADKDRGKSTILEATEGALDQCVEIGMTATQGQARCAELQLLYRSDEAEQEANELLLEAVEHLTPDFEATAPGVCTLDLLGNAEAVANAQRLGRKIVRWLAGHHLHVQMGFAAHPDLALLVAKQASPVLSIDDEDEVRFLAELPVSALELSADLQEVMRLWGIQSLGELMALPVAEVSERMGVETVLLLEKCRGKRRRVLELVRQSAEFVQHMEFEQGMESLDPLLFLIRRMLETLIARLAAIHLVVGELRLSLKFDDESKHERSFRVPDPSRDVDLLFRILHTYLEDLTAESPIVALTVDVKPSRSLAHQFDLFESSLRDPNRFSETLGRLEAMLGDDRVGTPEPLQVHQPDAFVMKPFQDHMANQQGSRRKPRKATPLEEALQARTDGIRLGLPLRRFRPPPTISVATEHDQPIAILSGQVQGRIVDQRGPWLLSGEWWHKDRWACKEWDVQLEDGGLVRIAEVKHQRWVLAGEYG